MDHGIVLKASAIVSAVFGLMLVFTPNQVVAFYGHEAMTAPGVYTSMLLGAMLLGFAVMNWAASTSEHYADVRYVILGNLISHAVGLLVVLSRQFMQADARPIGWVNVVIYAVFFYAFVYVYLKEHDAYAAGRNA